VILLRYIELASRTGRALNIIKRRNRDHTKAMYQVDIRDQGLTIGNNPGGATGLSFDGRATPTSR